VAGWRAVLPRGRRLALGLLAHVTSLVAGPDTAAGCCIQSTGFQASGVVVHRNFDRIARALIRLAVCIYTLIDDRIREIVRLGESIVIDNAERLTSCLVLATEGS
jgi:hypothetical protein